jgi:beta-N-acetylhexosaminidase
VTRSEYSRRTFLRRSFGALAGAGVAGHAPALLPPVQRKPQTLRDKVAQLFVISFQGTSAGPQILSLLERYAFGGVILYARNCGTATQIRTLTASLQAASRFPLLICVDQEGGHVVRIKHGAPVFPSEAIYGQLDSPVRVYTDAATTALDLRTLGLTMNLAPVVDVLSNPRSPIGQRSYGPDPRLASRLSVAAIQGYQQHRMAATAKHFIGLGHTSIDSHQSLPTVTKTWQQLEADDLIPFRAAISAGVSSLLVAHVALPKIDPVARPASLSPVIIKTMIRGKLGFKGVVMTDSLMMGAVPRGDEVAAAERALIAGADILLLGGNETIPSAIFSEAIERIVASVGAGRIPESWVDAALSRVLTLKQRYPPLS